MNIYETPAMKIGNNEWRCVVYFDKWANQNYTSYQFRSIGILGMEDDFRDAKGSWPKYDMNKSGYGMPKTLIKLYEKYKLEIEKALKEDRQ